MTIIKINSLVAGIILVGLAGYGAGLVGQHAQGSRSAGRSAHNSGEGTATDGQLAQAQPQRTKKPANPRRAVELGKPAGIYSNIEGQTTIIWILPDETRVKKGDRICELDSAALRDRLVNQRITTKSAEANYQNAKLTREVAEIAVHEYINGDFVSQRHDVAGELKIAEAELALARAEFNAAISNKASELTIKRLELAVLRATIALEKAQSRLKVLLDYTKDRKIKELETAVRRAQSDELAKQATWELERQKEEKLERQIAACTIVAPIDGTLRYAWRLGIGPLIEEGSTVRE